MRLFTDVVSKSPGKDRAYNALSWAYYKRHEYDQAIDVLQQGFEKLPDKAMDFADTLGNLYLKTGRYDQAVELFKKTTQSSKGERAIAYNNLGVAYLYMWNDLQSRRAQLSAEEFAAKGEQILKPAADAFLKGLAIDHDMPWALDSYINVMGYRGRGREVSEGAEERLKQKEDFENLYTVGKIAFNNGDYLKADQYFERAEKLRNDAKILFFNHGYALTQLGQDNRASEKYLQAIRIDPIFIEAHHNLGLIYIRQKEYAKAVEAFSEVLRQDGNVALARKHLATVLEASPGNQQAVAMLQQLDAR